MKKNVWISFNYFEIKLPIEALDDCGHPGPCDSDIGYWHPQVKKAFKDIDDQSLINELKGYGAWTLDELQDRETNEQRILWIASGNYQDGEY